MRSLILFTFLAIAAFVQGQHCPFDFAGIIVAHPHALGDTLLVPDLRITLLDTNNLPALDQSGQAMYHFAQNPAAADRGMASHAFIKRHRHDQFPFAKNNYVIILPARMDLSGYSIPVQDEADERSIHYDQTRIPITSNDLYPLCGVYDNAVHPALEGRPPFAPIDIPLQLLR